jgi:hypothetical protein
MSGRQSATFSLNLNICDPQQLFEAAVASYKAECPNAADADLAAFGTSQEPDLSACLVQILDPGRVAGCSVDHSACELH